MGVHKDADAVALYQRAATAGISAAQHHLGSAYAEGVGGLKRDVAAAVKWWTRAAQAGVSHAQLDLAAALWEGDGIPRDAPSAVKWWRAAASSGVLKAAENLAHAYAEGGEGVEEDVVEATRWAKVARALRRAKEES